MSREQYSNELDRAARAKEIVEHPLWLEAFEKMEQRCYSAWEHGQTTEAREEAWRTLNVAKKVRAAFEDCIKTGKMAEIALEKANG